MKKKENIMGEKQKRKTINLYEYIRNLIIKNLLKNKLFIL